MGLIENRSHTIEMPTANRTAVQITLQQITDGLTSPIFCETQMVQKMDYRIILPRAQMYYFGNMRNNYKLMGQIRL